MPSEEELSSMQEKIKDMSPEELSQFQKQNCVFCQIIEGKVNSKKIYEDDICIAILDINPANPGHLLLLPKEHYAIMPLMPEQSIKHLFMIAKQLSSVLLKSLKIEGTNIFVANGAVAGQKAQHFMIHIIPRMEKDDLNLNIEGEQADENLLEQIRKKLLKEKSEDSEEITVEKPSKNKKVVEAEFEDSKSRKEDLISEKEPGQEEELVEEEPKKQKKKDENVTLDDIADLITGGK